jgi:plastocyanin
MMSRGIGGELLIMAKKAKSAKKKVSTSRQPKTKHHHWHPHDFLLVVAGGFVVIVLIFILSGSFSVKTTPTPANQAAAEETRIDSQTEKNVEIEEFSYSPNPIIVKKGTTVTWTNNDTIAHSATADDGSFDTGFLENGESGSVTFNEVGEYPYYSSVYPNVKGKVVVNE